MVSVSVGSVTGNSASRKVTDLINLFELTIFEIMGDCAWVTHALNEGNVVRALVLGRSLRKVLTRHKLVVIVKPSTSLENLDALQTTFDFVLTLDAKFCGYEDNSKYSEEVSAKCFALSLSFFNRCIFTPPNILVLKNCDEEIFEKKPATRDFESLTMRENAGLEMFHFQPSWEAYRDLVRFMKSSQTVADNSVLFEQWTQNQQGFSNQVCPLRVSLGENQTRNAEPVICQLVSLPLDPSKLKTSDHSFLTSGLQEQFVYECWLDIYNETKTTISRNNIAFPFSSFETQVDPNSIAVVGMSCRFPASTNISEFWNLLIEGGDGICHPPEYRWTKEQSVHYPPDVRNTQAGFLTVPVDEFDAKFFGISPKEIIFIDPQHRLLHELVWEAMEDASINPLDLNGTPTGVFMGSWRNDYYDVLQRSASREFYRGYMGNSIGAGAARISHFLGLTGPCVSTESGCSAAMVAVHMARQSLQNGECSMALACGVNLLLHPFTPEVMPMVTSPDGHCKTFSADADGFGRAEGCAVLVLKKLADAVKGDDNIWGVIKGSAIAQEGVSKSMGTPTVQIEAKAMQNALRQSNVHPSQVSYVESHGTGTVVGDPMEVAAIARVYAEGRKEPLIIGSVKTNVGHTESCSGIAAIMKVLLSMKHEVIPPHRNFKKLNPDINLEVIPAMLPLEPMPWPRNAERPRIAGVSSFGITGTNGHVIIQEPPDCIQRQRMVFKGFHRPLHLLTISAKTEEALGILLEKYKNLLSSETISEDDFPNGAYTSNVGRAHFNWRVALVAKNKEDALEILKSNKAFMGEVETGEDTMTRKICFLFTGQGSQYHGMARELYKTSPVFQMNFDKCQKLLTTNHGIDIATALWGKDEELINRTLYSQTAIFVVEYCLWQLWESWGVKPDYVLGHSLGEFCAAICAGILTLEEALTLVAERSRLINTLPSGKMLVIKSNQASAESLLKKFAQEHKENNFELDCAAINSPDQTVFAGDSDKIERFAVWVKERAIKCSILSSSHAFHSRHMDAMLEEYGNIAKNIFKNKKITRLNCVFVSSMQGKIVDVSEFPVGWPEYWVQHTRETVNFIGASKALSDKGCVRFLEIGPHPVLTAFTMLNNQGKQLMCLSSLRKTEPNWMCMLSSLGKLYTSGAVTIDWSGIHRFYEQKKVGNLLPTYPFHGTKCWPNISSSQGVEIHPLLGFYISNPTKTKIYQNNLSLQNLEYLKDHMIGTSIVFPGAGYIETLLVAGHATLDGVTSDFRLPRRPIQLESFRIEAPLGLDENTGCHCQTVADWDDTDENSIGLQVKFYHEQKEGDEGSTTWIQHASARFMLYRAGNHDTVVASNAHYQEIIEEMKSSGKVINSCKELYDKAAIVGLVFGPTFQTLSKIWTVSDKEGLPPLLAEVKIPKDAGRYLLHPTLIDAMLQVTAHRSDKEKKSEKRLRVPVGCEKFVWFKNLVWKDCSDNNGEDLNICYVYFNPDSQTAVLLDRYGDPAAALVKLATIETNAKSVQALLQTQVKATPEFYNIDWKSSLGPGQLRVDYTLDALLDVTQVFENEPKDLSDYSESNLQDRRTHDILVSNYVTIAFLNLGWKPRLGDKIELKPFMEQLGILKYHEQLIRRFAIFLEEEKLLEKTCKDCWTVIALPEDIQKLQKESEEIVQRFSLYVDQSVGLLLDKILSGKESALKVLFPEDESKPSAAKFYNSGALRNFQGIIYRSMAKVWESVTRAYEGKTAKPVYRILEVGAGTGGFTAAFLDSLEAHGVMFEYHFTDLSPAFFSGAENRFKKHKKSMKYRKLNLEQDPTTQGFCPKYYDLVVAVLVIHATRDVRESLINVRQLMKDGGNLLLCEITDYSRPIDSMFGILEGYWRFTDFELRSEHTVISIDKWRKVGKETGFPEMTYIMDFECALLSFRADQGPNSSYGKLSHLLNAEMQEIHRRSSVAWVIVYGDEEIEYVKLLKDKFCELGRKTCILIKLGEMTDQDIIPNGNTVPIRSNYEIKFWEKEVMIKLIKSLGQPNTNSSLDFSSLEGILFVGGLCSVENRDQGKITQPFLHLLQSVLKLEKKSQPQIVVLTSGQYGIGDIFCENPSTSTLLGMSKVVANEQTELKIRGIDISPLELYSSVEEIFQELFTGFNEEVAHFCAFRKGERFIPEIVPERGVLLKGGGALSIPSSSQRFQLIHPKSKAIQDLEFGHLEDFTLKPHEIEIQVKCSALNFKDILNILKPTEEFEDSNGVGFDFAGVVIAKGSEVTLRNIGDPVFGINIMGNALPSHIKLHEEAVVSMPNALTFTEAACFPAVFSTAYICLVNVAQVQEGETLLIHTASGGVGLLAIQLAKHFKLKIICTAGSERKRSYLRSLGIQHVLHSRNTSYGEDIRKVTNGKGVDVVLNSLTGPGFKETTLEACAKGARFVEMSKLNIWSEEEMAERRPDVKYTIVDLTKLSEESSRKLLTESRQLLEAGVITPIPYTRFDAQNIRQALGYLQNAQHIGKVVVAMPETKSQSGGPNHQPYTPLFNERSTYLITGGLGGVGLEVCKYMLSQGARHVVLVGRNPPNKKVEAVIQTLNGDNGKNVVVLQADVGEWDQCQNIFHKISSHGLPPLRGVMHCAGTLKDALIENLSYEDFLVTYQSKVNGSWNLHELTKNLVLEHFVLFSSIAAPFGSPGQSTHVSACDFEDGLAHFRNSRGLPATSINFGQFGEVGIAIDMDFIGLCPFSTRQGINALDTLLRANKSQMIVASLDSALAVMVKYLPYSKRILDEQVFKVAGGGNLMSKKLQLSSTQFWEDYDDPSNDRAAKVEVLKRFTKVTLRHVLRLDQDEPIDENMNIQELGVDSLMMLELKNHLQEAMGDRVTISQSAVKDCSSVKELSDRLVQIIEKEGELSSPKRPTLDEVLELVTQDCKLPSEIQVECPGSEKIPSQIKVVLFTGATGTLGSHLLREVLEESPQLEKVYCLMRPQRGQQSPEQRLTAVLERAMLLSTMTNFHKVECLSGNFIEERFGLQEEEYIKLANEVDACIHCGAKVSHVEYYRIVEDGRTDARTVNVEGIKTILKFCVKSKTKHLFNASTLLGVPDVNEEDGTLSESWPSSNNLNVTHTRGYQMSKYVCELLLAEATLERGLPCKTFRFPELRGSRVTGQGLVESSHIMRSLLFFLKEGIIPQFPIAGVFLPVDLAARLAALIMFRDDAPNEPYNITHPNPKLVQEFFPILAEEMGYKVSIVSNDEYRARITERAAEDGKDKHVALLLGEFQDLYQDHGDDALGSVFMTPSMKNYLENVDKFWTSKRLTALVPEHYKEVDSPYDILKRDFTIAKKDGLFEKLGMQVNL